MIPLAGSLRLPLLAALGALFVWLLESLLDPYALSVAMFVGINIILAVSLNITNGFTGLFSLGHPGFMAVGGYVTALLTMLPARKGLMLPDLPSWLAGLHWGFLPALLAGGLCAVLVAVVVGFPVLRLRGHYLAVATLGFIIIVQTLLINLVGLTRGARGLNGLSPLTGPWWVYGWVVVTIYTCWTIKHASLGRAMLAIRENEMAAHCLGVNVTRVRLLAFVLGAFFAGVAGGLWAHLVTLVTPTSFSIVMSFMLVAMVVIGGSGSITGAVIAAAALPLASEAVRPIEEGLGLYGLSQVLVALGVLLILIYRPQGLFGTSEPRFLESRPAALAHPREKPDTLTEKGGIR
jgi:branched-chain amino acid transport system permease protein